MTLRFENDEAKALVDDITEYLNADPANDEEFLGMMECLERIRLRLETAMGHSEILGNDGSNP